jgi:hypothetical protein
MAHGSSPRRLCATARPLAVALLAHAAAARGDGLTGSDETTFSNTSMSLTDQAGQTSHSSTAALTSTLRLSFDRALFQRLSLSAGGNYQLSHGWTSTDVASGDLDSKRWSAFGALRFGDPVLGGTLGYDRRFESGENRVAGELFRSPTLISETYTFAATWAPLDLPRLSFLASRTNDFDAQRQSFDRTTDDLAVTATYQPIRRLDVRYAFHWGDALDRLSGVDTTSAQHAAGASWGDSFFDNRALLNLSYNVGIASTSTSVTGAGGTGTVATSVLPIAGLSGVEDSSVTPLVSPTNIKLSQNPQLTNSDTVIGAGINIGFSPTPTDNRIRDMGLQLSDAVTQVSPVNTIYVWVDKPIPLTVTSMTFGNCGTTAPELSQFPCFAAYTSDDNQNWTRVPIIPPATGGSGVAFGAFQNRFEITIAQTTAKYVKVVTRPLQRVTTQDPAFADIQVTEVQALLVVPASAVPRSQSRLSGSFSSTARVRVLRTVTYDNSFSFSHDSQSGQIPWTLQNGLSFADRLSSVFGAAARVERSDTGQSTGHTGEWRYSASLTADPLPTVTAGVSYGGRVQQAPEGVTSANSVGIFGRQDLYQGVSLSESTAYGINGNPDGRTIKAFSGSAGASVMPHRTATFSLSYSYTASDSTGGSQPDQSTTTMHIDASVSYNPVPAFYATAGVSHFTGGVTPTTTYNVSATITPFPGGDLVLRFAYLDAYDTASDTRTRQLGPSARWNISRSAFLDLSYTWLTYHSPALQAETRTLSAGLVVRLP